MQSQNPDLIQSREGVDAWLKSEKVRLKPKFVGLGHWFHDKNGIGFGVSLTCFFGISGEFHVTDEGCITYCLGKFGGDEDEVSGSLSAVYHLAVSSRPGDKLLTGCY